MNYEHFIPKIAIIGVGGAGVNGINHIMSLGLDVECIIANTDAQSLSHSLCKKSIKLGQKITKGLGAGADYNIGRLAAEESAEEIKQAIKGFDMLFIVSGMGGGTGTGASAVVAKIAKELEILTVAVVTKPFSFEGPRREKAANYGISQLEPEVDTMILISNDNLLRMATEKTSFAESFRMADQVQYNSVKSVVELLTKPGFVNRDFADLKTVMEKMGRAMIGYAESSGENRVDKVVSEALYNPILDNSSIEGASSILLNITGSDDLCILEVQKITEQIRAKLHPDANFLFGTVLDNEMQNSIRVSIIATGMPKDRPEKSRKYPEDVIAEDDIIPQNNKINQEEVEIQTYQKINNIFSTIQKESKTNSEDNLEKEFRTENNFNKIKENKNINETEINSNKFSTEEKQIKKNSSSIFGNIFSNIYHSKDDKKKNEDLKKKEKELPLFNINKTFKEFAKESSNIIKGIDGIKAISNIEEDDSAMEDEMLDMLKIPSINRVA